MNYGGQMRPSPDAIPVPARMLILSGAEEPQCSMGTSWGWRYSVTNYQSHRNTKAAVKAGGGWSRHLTPQVPFLRDIKCQPMQ